MSDAPRRWKLGCLGLSALTLILLATLAALWLSGRGDLDAVDARAKGMGIEPTWTSAGASLSPQPVLTAWNRVLQLSESLRSYTDSPSGGNVLRPGTPPPPELVRHHATLPAADLAELDGLCETLVPDSVTTLLDVDFLTPLPCLGSGRQLTRLMAERSALATPYEALRLLRLDLNAIMAERVRSLIQGLVVTSRLAIWQQAASRLLHDPATDRVTLAAMADEARTWLDTNMDGAWCGEYRLMRTSALQIAAGDPRYATGLLTQFDLPAWMDGHGLHRPLMRLARRRLLELDLELIATWRSSPVASMRMVAMRAIDTRVAATPAWDFPNHVLQMLMPGAAMICTTWARTDASLRVLAAELRGEAWPTDPTDPAGGRVRRIERDGRLIGFYLLNSNGTDEGGRSGKDHCVALYEELGNPLASDPPRKP